LSLLKLLWPNQRVQQINRKADGRNPGEPDFHFFASFLKLIAPVGVTDGGGEKREHDRQKPKILHLHLLCQKPNFKKQA